MGTARHGFGTQVPQNKKPRLPGSLCPSVTNPPRSGPFIPGFNLRPSCPERYAGQVEGVGIPVESLNIHVLCDSSSKGDQGDRLSDSLN